jgi:hypothetical protein
VQLILLLLFVCQSIEMAKAIVADHDKLFKNQQVNVEAKKTSSFFSYINYQSTDYPTSFYEHSSSVPFYDEGVPSRGAQRSGKRGTH